MTRMMHNPIVRAMSSLRLAVTCLTLLLLLTFWGTLYQTELWGDLFGGEYGLYAAQQRFFNTWVLSAADLIPITESTNPILALFMKIPLPATRLVMWVFFVNLMFFMLFKMNWCLKRIGIVIIHFGILLFFVSSFMTFHFAEESSLRIVEGHTSNVTAAYNKWELAVMKIQNRTDTEQVMDVWAIDANGLTAGNELTFDGLGLDVSVLEYHDNCDPVALPDEEIKKSLTPFGSLAKLQREREPERNFPGGHFVFRTGEEPVDLVLHSLMQGSVPLTIGGQAYTVALQRKQYQLPFSIHLRDVMQEVHEGTSIARNYQSKVDMIVDGVPRAVDITMNHPLRDRSLTFFQANYERLQDGSEASRFAVVENRGRVLPYVASTVTVGGLIIHFLMMLVTHMKRAARKAAA